MDLQGGAGGKVLRPRANRPTPYDRPNDRPAPPTVDVDQGKGLFGSLYAFAITPLRAVGGLLGVVSPTCAISTIWCPDCALLCSLDAHTG